MRPEPLSETSVCSESGRVGKPPRFGWIIPLSGVKNQMKWTGLLGRYHRFCTSVICRMVFW